MLSEDSDVEMKFEIGGVEVKNIHYWFYPEGKVAVCQFSAYCRQPSCRLTLLSSCWQIDLIVRGRGWA